MLPFQNGQGDGEQREATSGGDRGISGELISGGSASGATKPEIHNLGSIASFSDR